MKGAIIPPTRENMEQVPSPTFLKGTRKIILKKALNLGGQLKNTGRIADLE